MDNDIYSQKMGNIKKGVKTLFIVSMIMALATFVMLICFNFAGVFSIKTIAGTKYENGFTYPGWQAIFFGMGEMMIQGYTEFSFDIWTCIGLFLPFFAILVCSIIYLNNASKKGTNKKKAILEIVMGVSILIGVILLFNCDLLTIENAKNVTGSYQNYYEEYLLKALNGEEYFRKEAYPTILLIVGIITALIKFANAGLLIYQKKFALANRPSKETK